MTARMLRRPLQLAVLALAGVVVGTAPAWAQGITAVDPNAIDSNAIDPSMAGSSAAEESESIEPIEPRAPQIARSRAAVDGSTPSSSAVQAARASSGLPSRTVMRAGRAVSLMTALEASSDSVEASSGPSTTVTGESPPTSARTTLLVVGAATVLGGYGFAIGTSYLWPSSPAAGRLRWPVVGPYAAIPKSGCGDDERGCDTLPVVIRSLLTGLSAITQTGGVLLLGEALFMPTSAAKGDNVEHYSEGASDESSSADWFASPIVSSTEVGFQIGGTF